MDFAIYTHTWVLSVVEWSLLTSKDGGVVGGGGGVEGCSPPADQKGLCMLRNFKKFKG